MLQVYACSLRIPFYFFYVFYRKCIIGALTVSVGDFVLVSNADSVEPDTVAGCDVAKIITLFEIDESSSGKDPCRAIVQWYSR